MNFADYIAPTFDFGLGPEWKVIIAKTGILDQFWSLGLKYYAPNGNIYGTYTYIDETLSLHLHSPQLQQWTTECVYKMKAAILCKMEEYKLQDGMVPLPFGAIPNPIFNTPFGPASRPRRDVDKYDYLLEESK
jgi:hypothetical protein